MDSATAKQFFISKVIGEAEFESIKLSEVERKMPYFTELHPSLPDIYEVSADFETNYDPDEYEDKIGQLLKNARRRDVDSSPGLEQGWRDSLDALKNEDHCILVLLHGAFPAYRKPLVTTHLIRDYALYIAIGVALVVALEVAAFWRS
jgi:hypothetical protein